MSSVIDAIAGLPPGLLLALVFALPAAESGILIGVFIPGETAVLLGGVSAHESALPLWSVITAAILGAVIGDQVGFLVGRRFGDGLLAHVPRWIWKPDSIAHTLAVIERRGALAVIIGRWAAALRAFVPGIAGVSGMSRRAFTIANVIGGASWAVAISLAGYAAGASYRDIEDKFGRAGQVVTAVVVVALVAVLVVRHFRTGTGSGGDSSADVDADPDPDARSGDPHPDDSADDARQTAGPPARRTGHPVLPAAGPGTDRLDDTAGPSHRPVPPASD